MRGDFGQLLQLADNLIANAIRYGCSDNALPGRGRRCGATASAGLLVVRDQGDGIAPEHLPRLTERFYRVDAARSRESGGTGLGLAIVKHIVERHRGTLDIRSAPGRGHRSHRVACRSPERRAVIKTVTQPSQGRARTRR